MQSNVHSLRLRARDVLAAVGVSAAVCVSGGCDESGSEGEPVVASFHASVPASFVSHRSRGKEVTIKTPRSWKETSTSGCVVLNLLTDEPASSVNVVVVSAKPHQTLDVTMQEVPEFLRHELADYSLLKNEVVFIRDQAVGRIEYEASRGGFHGKVMTFIFTHASHNYILTYTAAPDRYAREADVVEAVVDSLKIEK